MISSPTASRSPGFARWIALAWVAGALLAWLLPWPSGSDGLPAASTAWMAPLFWPTGLIQAFPTFAFLLAWALPVASLLCWRRGMWRWALLLACTAGGLHTLLPSYVLLAETPVFDERIDCHIEGVVRGLVDDRQDRRRFSLELVEARAVDADQAAARRVCGELPEDGRIKLSDYTAVAARTTLRSGFRYRLQARLKPLHGHANPGGFDYRRWLFRHRLLSTGYLREAQPVALGPAPGVAAGIERLRDAAQARLQSSLDHAGRVSMLIGSDHLVAAPGLLQGQAIGDRNQLEQEQWEVLLASGTNHLLTGDIEAAEQWLVRHADLSADVVLVPHHGSMTSSTPAFIAATQANAAVVSAGYLNRWDHPRGEVVARWRSAGAQVFRTDRHGAIHLATGGMVGERANHWPTAWQVQIF